MGALRCLIDSMVFDAIAAEPELMAAAERLTSSRHLELLAAAETMREIASVPDRAHRRRLQRVRVIVVPPADRGDAGTRRRLERLRASPGVSDGDARIAAAAAFHGVPLVTEDADLIAAVAAELPGVATWRWAADLRPRLLALDRAHPAPPGSAMARRGRGGR